MSQQYLVGTRRARKAVRQEIVRAIFETLPLLKEQLCELRQHRLIVYVALKTQAIQKDHWLKSKLNFLKQFITDTLRRLKGCLPCYQRLERQIKQQGRHRDLLSMGPFETNSRAMSEPLTETECLQRARRLQAHRLQTSLDDIDSSLRVWTNLDGQMKRIAELVEGLRLHMINRGATDAVMDFKKMHETLLRRQEVTTAARFERGLSIGAMKKKKKKEESEQLQRWLTRGTDEYKRLSQWFFELCTL